MGFVEKDPSKKTSHVLQVASFKSELDAKEFWVCLIPAILYHIIIA